MFLSGYTRKNVKPFSKDHERIDPSKTKQVFDKIKTRLNRD
jgi:hypothetical protein